MGTFLCTNSVGTLSPLHNPMQSLMLGAGARHTPSGPGSGTEDSMRKAESAGIRDLESCLLVRLALKASWLSLASCTAAQRVLIIATAAG